MKPSKKIGNLLSRDDKILRQKCKVQVWNLYSPLSHCWVLHTLRWGGQYKLLCRHRHHHSIQDDNTLPVQCVNTHVVKCQIWHILLSYDRFPCFQTESSTPRSYVDDTTATVCRPGDHCIGQRRSIITQLCSMFANILTTVQISVPRVQL